MTRKDFYDYAKKYGFAILGALPFLILAGVLLGNIIDLWLLIVINSIILLIAFMCAIMISDKHKQIIAIKRQAYLEKKEFEKEQELKEEQEQLKVVEERVNQEKEEEDLRKKENKRKAELIKNKKYGHYNNTKSKKKK